MRAVPSGQAAHGSWLAPRVIDVAIAARSGAEADDDRAFVRGLGRRCAMSSVDSFRPAGESDVQAAFDRLCEIVESQSHVALIARWDGERVGFLLMLDDMPDEVTLTPQAFVAYMAVDPGHRGEGVGAALLAAAEDEARRLRLPYMSLMVTEENGTARALYDRAGYRTERRLLVKHL